MVGNEKQTDSDVLLPHVSAAYNNSVNAATGLAPNEIHIGRLPRLPLSVFEPENIGGHQSLDRDHLVYINLATDRQQRAYSLVRELHRLTVSRLQRRNAPIMAALLASPPLFRWRLGLGLQLRLHYPSGCQEGHRRNRSEDEALVELERTFQDPRAGPDCSLRHPRQPPATRQAALPRCTFRPFGTGLQTTRLRPTMQALQQPRRHQRHTQAPTSGPHNIRPHSFRCQVPRLPRHPQRRHTTTGAPRG